MTDSRGDGNPSVLQTVGSRVEHLVPPTEAVDLDRLDVTRHALLIDSRLLGESVWLVSDDSHAADLRRELARDGDQRLIFTLAEVEALRGMAEADARTVADVKRHFAGAALRSVEIIKGIG
jgi:hypothetical protein